MLRKDKIANTYAPIPVDSVLKYAKSFDIVEHENDQYLLFSYIDKETNRKALLLEDVMDLSNVLETYNIYTKSVPVCLISTDTWNINSIHGQRSLTGSRRRELHVRTGFYTDITEWLHSLEPYVHLKSTKLQLSFNEIFDEAVCIAQRTYTTPIYMSTHVFHAKTGIELGVLHWYTSNGISTGVHVWTTDDDIRRRYSLNTLLHCSVVDYAKSIGDKTVDYLYYYDYKKILGVQPTYYGGL